LPSVNAGSGGLYSRLVKAVDWIKTRLNNIDIFDEHYQNEAKTNPFYALGPIFYLIWFIVMATGCVLIMWYIPTKAAAFDSIFTIQTVIPFGGLMRGMHKYGADAMIIAATMRMYRMFIMGDFKPGKEFNIAIGLIALLLSMYSGLTGYLLIWNQRAFWATKVFATFPTYMDQFAVIGDFYQPFIKSMHMGWNTAEALLGGGAAITQETITRFFSLHLAFSLIPLIFIEIYFFKNAYVRVRLNWLKRTIVILMLVVVSVILPAAQGHRSNPDVTPLPILSDWYFLGLYQMYKYLEPVVATYITLIIPLSVVVLPFIDTAITGPEKTIMKRPFIFMVSIMAIVTWVAFSLLIIAGVANIHDDPPYWRSSFYLLIDAGIVWQLWLIWTSKSTQERIKGASGAFVMGVIGAVQTFWAWVYYYMAQTELFIDPMGHQFLYRLSRMFIGPAKQIESAVDKLVPIGFTLTAVNQDFFSFVKDTYLEKGGLAAKAAYDQLQSLVHQHTGLDWLVSWIPTYTPATHPHYHGLIDFMVTNYWAYDFVNFTNRMTLVWRVPYLHKVPGLVPGYPMPVPQVDLIWMWAGPITMLLAFGTWIWCKSAPKEVSQPTEAGKVPIASTT
jgi:quinol-cytochrome oxidoreductase complex cytochrome b subunit